MGAVSRCETRSTMPGIDDLTVPGQKASSRAASTPATRYVPARTAVFAHKIKWNLRRPAGLAHSVMRARENHCRTI